MEKSNIENSDVKKLVVEHASLVSCLADDNNEDISKIMSRLAEIEDQLNLRPAEIAAKAIQIYEAGYKN